ncbi:MAG: copper-binding protein [Proteobacteria bacterium]|nr:copper-binding protein [Pseudomonadota bacterium]
MKMRFSVSALSLALLASAPAYSANEHDAHHAAEPSAAGAVAELSEGTVKKVDKAAGKLTISHGPLKSLDMPAMTMVFRAADAAMLDKVKAGDRIRFDAARVGGAFTVTVLEVAP